ncbi:DUF3347 domain-containing protein [Pedobacter alpinus]|uniref:DUF3347 domain-containing protein n=1 Tax=Pedobacter alpinus TaxID=1590643 RepID=A0ABW5TTJ5_9SPHI
MKNQILGLAFIGLISTTYACTNPTKTVNEETASTETEQVAVNPKFTDAKVNEVYQHYIHLKTALVNNDNKEAEMGAKMLQKAMSDAEIDTKSIDAVVAVNNVETKRAKFNDLSNELASVFKKSKLESGIVYKQYCPMANDGKGGYWLASESKIKNPYYGEKMLGCGSIEEEIK